MVCWVNDWVLSMERRGLSPATIYRRERCVQLLFDELGTIRVSTEEIEGFLDRRHLGNRTRYCWISHLGKFYEWAVVNEKMAKNPIARLQRPKMGRLVPHPTPEREVTAAIAGAPTALLKSWITLMAFAGLRCCEIATLQGENIDHDANTMRVVGKFQKTRVIPMHRLVRKELERVGNGPIYIDPGTGKPYHPQRVSRLVGLHLREMGGTHVRAHRLRHRFATALLAEGVDIAIVAELLGHESIETTRGYAQVGFNRLEQAVALIA